MRRAVRTAARVCTRCAAVMDEIVAPTLPSPAFSRATAVRAAAAAVRNWPSALVMPGEDERALLQVRDPEGDLAGGGEPVPGGPVRPALELRQVEAFGDAAPAGPTGRLRGPGRAAPARPAS